MGVPETVAATRLCAAGVDDAELSHEVEPVDVEPHLGELPVLDPEHPHRRELDPLAGRGDRVVLPLAGKEGSRCTRPRACR